MAHFLQCFHGLGMEVHALPAYLVGKPLLCEASHFNRVLNRNPEIEQADHHVQNCIWNCTATGTAGYQNDPSISDDDRRCHGADRTFTGCDDVWSRAHLAFGIRFAGEEVEGAHVVI